MQSFCFFPHYQLHVTTDHPVLIAWLGETVVCYFWHTGTLTLRVEYQSACMPLAETTVEKSWKFSRLFLSRPRPRPRLFSQDQDQDSGPKTKTKTLFLSSRRLETKTLVLRTTSLLLSQERLKLRTASLADIFSRSIWTKAHENIRRKGSVVVSLPNFLSTAYYVRNR